MKIRKIILKDYEIREVDGEYQSTFFNEKTYPAFLSNYALKKGRDMGLIDSSVFSEVLKLQDGDLSQVDENYMLKIIYLSFKGANPKAELSFDEFLDKFHYSLVDTAELYSDLVSDMMTQDENAFVEGLENSTDKSKKPNEKK